ncbi:hypothetical protein SAMN05216464_110187 [Mucilaginibacter pineti]|uniref:Uncharacterized protein n=1 Tax=Mucilaginibacter pineti TaxID=1391627 RepID=A0A1G7GKH6_9SPHI|nr:hypothetical protein [Mucilaginibacter pineti]SDE88647.1 hypothetical protein SAMN05216464_110187 [Mucilaginibacter pineti]
MLKKTKSMKGCGNQIPPKKKDVIVWFIQKDSNEITALAFFTFYAMKNWQNSRGHIIADWKVKAWDWLWSKVPGYRPLR